MGKQSEYYAVSGQAQKRASLPSVSLLGGYAHRGTGINPLQTRHGWVAINEGIRMDSLLRIG